MKNLITLVIMLLMNYLAIAQEMNVETKSVSIDNLITFIVDAIENKDEESDDAPEHYIFLIQTPVSDLIAEDKVILKQAFKLISKRLALTDHISIVTYSGFSGIALKKTSAKDLKEIMYALEHLKSNVKELHKDGIELAYTYANEQADEDTLSTVVMIRNPKTMLTRSTATLAAQTVVPVEVSKNNNAVLLTAITLLPQIISVIKD
ncbi:MAG: hypothetical protein V7719_06910 [Psychroserpens sp.]|uniref:hypothetical protein n=1 Tax=Psychroserpens sp. TaxID=2020870 RepID=UPI003001966C